MAENIDEIKKFLEKEEPWNYNFECESGNEEFLSLKTLERYFAYKASGKTHKCKYKNANSYIEDMRSKYEKVYDPDGSGSGNKFYPLTHAIYFALWGWKRNCGTFGDIGGDFPFAEEKNKYKFGSDTMNSVQSAFNELWKNELSDILSREDSILLLPECIMVSIERMFERIQTEHDFCNALAKRFQGTYLIEYIESYHTLGNLVLVPSGFNKDRGNGNILFSSPICKRGYEWNSNRERYELKVYDYLDLSLEYLKENGYGKFKKDDFTPYINYFFLWDWVTVDDHEKYQVKLIGMNEMGEKRNLSEFFDKTVKMIKRRGKFMTAMLIIAIYYPNLYENIRKFFLENIFQGINGAAKRIFEKYQEEIAEERAVKLLKELVTEELD